MVMMSDEGGEHGIYVQVNGDDADDEEGKEGDWRLVYAPKDGATVIEDMTVNRHAMTVLERSTSTGLPVVRVLPLARSGDTNDGHIVDVDGSYTVQIPDFALDCRFGANEDYGSELVELEFLSPIVPTIRVGVDVVTRKSYMTADADVEEDEAIVENNLSNYSAVRIPFTATNGGHTIPLTLAYRNDATNPSPALWIVYGAYGESLDMEYAPHLISLMNRGYKIIWCHVRGGGELGRAFYEAGRRRNLEHSADDLRTCMKFMKERGVTSRNAVYSFSAGAIAACGALGELDDPVDAVVLESPLVDLVDAMHDDGHALTRHEHDEFGDPSDEQDLAVMRRACPLTRLADSPSDTLARPPMLLCSGTDDEHVREESIRRYARAYGDTAVLWQNAYDGHLPETTDELLAVRAGQLAFIIDDTL
jgi:protease II